MAPLRVLYLINGLGTGGAERSLAETLPLLPDRDVDATVLCLYRRDEGVQQSLIEAGYDIRFVGGTNLASRALAVRRAVQELSPDVLHTTIFESNLIGRLAGYRLLPVITSLVSTPYDPARVREDPNVTKFGLTAVRRVDGFTSRRLTTHFHAVSETVKRSAIEALRIETQQITVIHRGRDPKRLGEPSVKRRQRVRSQLGLGPSQPVLANIGRQEYAKGHKYLIGATADLRVAHPDLVTLIVGRTGHASQELKDLIAHENLENAVVFLGHTESVGDVLAAADIFVLPSIYEGLPGVVIEAMALGLPVVASDLPQVREVVQENHNALLAAVGSRAEIASAVDRLLSDVSLRRDFGAANQKDFHSRFTIDRFVDKLVALYSSVITAAEGRFRS